MTILFKIKTFFLLFLLVLLTYVSNISNIPSEIILFDGETYSIKTVFGITKNNKKVIPTSLVGTDESNILSEETISLGLLNVFNIKDINIITIKQQEVVPLRKYNWIKAVF